MNVEKFKHVQFVSSKAALILPEMFNNPFPGSLLQNFLLDDLFIIVLWLLQKENDRRVLNDLQKTIRQTGEVSTFLKTN